MERSRQVMWTCSETEKFVASDTRCHMLLEMGGGGGCKEGGPPGDEGSLSVSSGADLDVLKRFQ